jgi:RAP domain
MFPPCRLLGFILWICCVFTHDVATAFVVQYSHLNCRIDTAKSWANVSQTRRDRLILFEAKSSRDNGTPEKRRSNSNPSSSSNQRRTNSNSHHRSSNAKRDCKSSPSPYIVLNKALVQADSAFTVLELLQCSATLNQEAGGTSLNAVNFATSWNRLARFSMASSFVRNEVVKDARTALLLACTAEALATKPQQFQGRALASLAWALAKLNVAPPQSEQALLVQLPPALDSLPRHEKDHAESESRKALLEVAATVRQIIADVARERSQDGDCDGARLQPRSMSTLSKLAGHLLDAVGEVVWYRFSRNSNDSTGTPIFDMQSWSNLLWAWSTGGHANEALFGVVIRRMIAQQEAELRVANKDLSTILQPQDWANAIWAVATAQCYDGHEDLLVYVAQLLDEYPHFVGEFNSQNLSNTIWSVATLLSNKKQPGIGGGGDSEREQQAALIIVRHCLRSVVQRQAIGFRTQDLSNTAWAVATLGFGLSTAASAKAATINNYIVLTSLQPVADAQLAMAASQSICIAAHPLLPRFTSQGLSNLAWALTRLVSGDANVVAAHGAESSLPDTTRSLMFGIGRQLGDPRCAVSSQDVAITLWALATLKIDDDSIYRSMAMRLTLNQAHGYKPQDLSISVWVLATAEVTVEEIDIFDTSLVPGLQQPHWPQKDPVAACFALAAQELMRRPQQFTSQGISNVLWSFSTAGIRHPILFRSIAEHAVGSVEGECRGKARGLDEFSSQDLSNMAWAFARQAQVAESASERLNRIHGRGRPAVNKYQTICIDIGEALMQRLFGAIAETSLCMHGNLSKAAPQELSNLAWAFATLGLKHTRFLEAVKMALVERVERYVRGEKNLMTSFSGQHLANLLWALVTLNVSLGSTLEAIMPYLRKVCVDSDGKFTSISISSHFNRRDLSDMAWACAACGNYPNNLMVFLYTGLLGPQGEGHVPLYMQSIHKDSGLQVQEVTTLIYVQAEMDLRSCSHNLALPANFPDGWSQSKTGRRFPDDHLTGDTMGLLTVSTSKTQRAVSAALSRIGFDHLEEHTITMAELSGMHVRVPSRPIEILSIDIANIEEKIAIEVDGPTHYVTCIDDVQGNLDSSGSTIKVNGRLEYRVGWTGERQEVNGSTALKSRLLQALGWKVIRLPFWEWGALEGDLAAEEAYCSQLLAANH